MLRPVRKQTRIIEEALLYFPSLQLISEQKRCSAGVSTGDSTKRAVKSLTVELKLSRSMEASEKYLNVASFFVFEQWEKAEKEKE